MWCCAKSAVLTLMTRVPSEPVEFLYNSSWDSVALVTEHTQPIVLFKREISHLTVYSVQESTRIVIETVMHHIFFIGRLHILLGTDVQRQHMCADVILRQRFTLFGLYHSSWCSMAPEKDNSPVRCDVLSRVPAYQWMKIPLLFILHARGRLSCPGSLQDARRASQWILLPL